MRIFPRRREGVAAPPSRLSRATWPWAVGTVLVVAVVIIAALGARHVIAGTRHAALAVPAPALPMAEVAGATPANTYVQLLALDASAGHLVALSSATQPQCSPVGPCPAAPALTSVAMFDAATGRQLFTSPLTGPAAAASNSVLLLADAGRHVAYAISPHAVTVFSTVTGATVGSYTVPLATWPRVSDGALDAQRGVLALAGGSQLLALDAATGHVLASRDLGADITISALAVNPTTGTIYTLLRQPDASQRTLATFDDAALAPQARLPLPASARLGPLDAAADTLYLPGASGGNCAYSLRTAQLTPAPAGICDALALGWSVAGNHLYTADADTLTVRDPLSGRPLAALPIRAAWPGDQPMLLDSGRGLLYVPDDQGRVLIVHDGARTAALSAGSALLVARAALARLLSDTNQDPSFVSPETFPAAPGMRQESYWIHFSDLGWQGPYPGSAASAISPLAGGAGGYTATFTITWNQLFLRQHSWTCDVLPNGAVRLVSESGDALP